MDAKPDRLPPDTNLRLQMRREIHDLQHHRRGEPPLTPGAAVRLLFDPEELVPLPG